MYRILRISDIFKCTQIRQEEKNTGFLSMIGSHMASILSRTSVLHLYFHQHSASAWQVTSKLDLLLPTELTTLSSAYPDGHPGSDLDEDQELAFLKAKIDAGADFIVTQLFYDTDRFGEWIQKVRQKGAYFSQEIEISDILSSEPGIHVPIIPCIMPIQTYSSFLRLAKLCGSRVPPSLMISLEAISVSLMNVYSSRFSSLSQARRSTSQRFRGRASSRYGSQIDSTVRDSRFPILHDESREKHTTCAGILAMDDFAPRSAEQAHRCKPVF